jgi:ABC-type multidrug transport system fused ATPase/permease subunit
MIKQVYPKEFDNKNRSIFLAIIYILAGSFCLFLSEGDIFILLISIIFFVTAVLFYLSRNRSAVVNENFEQAVNTLDKYYGQGKSIDDFWEDDSLFLQKFFPNKK